ncbi:MAG: phosphotransferase [Burkholderiaceae bacterium]
MTRSTDRVRAEPTSNTLADGLARALARVGLPPPVALERLSGGANMESWRLQAGGNRLVLRRAPSMAMAAQREFSLRDEARLIRAVGAAGVMVPQIVVELQPDDGIGAGFVMRSIAGSADPVTILSVADPGTLLSEIAQALAAIHRVDVGAVGDVPVMESAEALAGLGKRFLDYGGDRPVLALALHWLQANIPAPATPRLVHGDFRLGNLMVDDGRLSGVLDWELAHIGDPVEDLAYACMTVWRFSRPDRPALGLGAIIDWLSAYETAGGDPVDRKRFRFWLVYRTFWWAVSCLGMGVTWRNGSDRSLERLVIGRRCAEQELDLLLMLEESAPLEERRRPLPRPGAEAGAPTSGVVAAGSAGDVANIGEPSASELLTAVAEWLASDVKPLVSGRGHFNLAVARNALGIVQRELDRRPQASDAALAADLLAGRADLGTPGVLARLRRMALDKIAADRPKYPAHAMARARWERN